VNGKTDVTPCPRFPGCTGECAKGLSCSPMSATEGIQAETAGAHDHRGAGTFAMVDRVRGKLTVWREGLDAAEPEVLVKRDGLVRGLHGAEGRTWEAVVALLNALGVLVEERT